MKNISISIISNFFPISSKFFKDIGEASTNIYFEIITHLHDDLQIILKLQIVENIYNIMQHSPQIYIENSPHKQKANEE
jgi:hypothetical protein